MTLLADLVAVAGEVAGTRSRTKKINAIADFLATLAAEEVAVATGFLTGAAKQGRIGVGWARLGKVEATPPERPTLVIGDVDAALDEIAATTGAGSGEKRGAILAGLFDRATADEADFLKRLLLGDLRQGALEGIMADAVARASAADADLVRRAWMLSGDLRTTAQIALTEGDAGLKAIGLEVLRPVEPMLASTAEDVASALAGIGPASVEWKLDGIRIQVHRSGETVRIFTRNLNDITDRLPEIVEITRSFDADSFVLDGEAIALGADERPLMFQDIMSRAGSAAEHGVAMVPFFFDLLHARGEDVLDHPLSERRTLLEDLVGDWRIPAAVTSDPSEGEAFLRQALDAGHEGVVVKGTASPYQAGRRGTAWRKVKPAHTLDLVVLGAEWGYGRRTGWLSNIHLGARDPNGGFVMVGKTFKGMTDETLKWQTEEFLKRETSRSGIVVFIKPEIVVEIAVDGVQASSKYPGRVALRFARVKHYRPDKGPDDADTIEGVRAMLPRER